MILNINNVLQNPQATEPNATKKPVELHTIFSTEVLNNTKMAFEKMLNMKVINADEHERTVKTIDKIVTDKKNTPTATAPSTTTNSAA